MSGLASTTNVECFSWQEMTTTDQARKLQELRFPACNEISHRKTGKAWGHTLRNPVVFLELKQLCSSSIV